MNVNLLIDAIVRKTTVLIATLATAGGSRAPLANVADRVFASLVNELKEQGLNNRIIADMFGLALRTYHNQVSRLSESKTHQGRSLWEAVLSYIQDKGVASRADVLSRFKSDDDELVKSVLKDLVDTGLVFRSGRSDNVIYRTATLEEVAATSDSRESDARANLVLAAIHRYGPMNSEALSEIVPMPDYYLKSALEQLVTDGRTTVETRANERVYRCVKFLIPFSDPAGWEASVFDHYQAMVTALCIKVRKGKTTADLSDVDGGSTYTFDVWNGHPYIDEVLAFLQTTRQHARQLRENVEAYNTEHRPSQSLQCKRVIAYIGQTVLEEEDSRDA